MCYGQEFAPIRQYCRKLPFSAWGTLTIPLTRFRLLLGYWNPLPEYWTELHSLDLHDGSGHSSKEAEFPKWHGESVGFWDGDTLIIHTNQV
jgi:hypothetical protein